MTPSEAHDLAWQRAPEHDEMTIACRDILEQRWKTYNWPVSINYKEKENKPHELDGIWCEEFFVPDHGPRWFADILARWTYKWTDDRKDEQTHTIYGVFEIKPKLYSAGAALRQRAVQKERLKAWVSGLNGSPYYGDKYSTLVDLIATEGDPLIKTVIDLGRTSILVWDGQSGLIRRVAKKPVLVTSQQA